MKLTTLLSLTAMIGFGPLAPLVFAAPRPEPRTAESAVTPVDYSRHGEILRQIKASNGEFGLLLIGDSITFGWLNGGKSVYEGFSGWKPLNLGVSGEHTEHVLYRLVNGELEGIKPKAAMIMIGTNNLGHASDEKPEWTAAGVKKIVETVRAKLPNTKILLLGIFPRSEKATDSIRVRVNETNKLIAKLGDGKLVRYMDLGDKFTNPDGSLKKELFVDNLHPNAAGYQVWIDAVKPTLEEMMR